MEHPSLTLLELNTEIRDTLKEHTAKRYWVIGEISELKVNFRDHCYLELIQKSEDTEHIVARSRATIWAQNFRLIKPYFETTTGQALVEGLSILVKISVEFHEVFGLSLNIHDIEPTYTVGEMALRKQKILERLQNEGVMGMNKEVEMDALCQKIAVISSPTAAGYGDFMDQLVNNPFSYKFYIKLFPAAMQGDEAEKSIIAALDRIFSYEDFFDAVVIIRGGGAQADLNCFNSYWLAYHITQYPLPVITGIGHEQDDTIIDLVAHTRLKTPTAVAAFLIENLAEVEQDLDELTSDIQGVARDFIDNRSIELGALAYKIQSGTKELISTLSNRLMFSNTRLVSLAKTVINMLNKKLDASKYNLAARSLHLNIQWSADLTTVSRLLRSTIKQKLKQQVQRHAHIEDHIHALDPGQVLKRGYSITQVNGKVVTEAFAVNTGDKLQTILYKGKIESTINKIKA